MKSKFYIRLHCLITLLFGFFNANGQISDYTFSQATLHSQYINMPVGSTQLGSVANGNPLKVIYTGNNTIGSTANIDTGPGFPIGFNFIYHGKNFDRVALSGNGYLKLGHSYEPITLKNDSVAGAIFNGDSYHQNIIAAFQTNASIYLSGITSLVDISVYTVGLPGNRIFVAQYDFAVNYGGYPGYPINLSYQIALFEEDNSIQITYRTFYNYVNSNLIQGAVGITDDQGNYNSRKVTSGINTWLTSVAGSFATDLCDFTPTFGPQGDQIQNLVYTWVPPLPVPSVPTCPEAYITVNPSYTNGYEYNVGLFYIPLDSAINVPTNSIINWSDVSYISHQPTSYDVYLDVSNPPLIPVAQNLATTSYTPSMLAPNTKYYYNIVPKNVLGKDSVCVGSFTTDSVLQYCEIGGKGDGYINTLTLNTFSFVYSNSNATIYKFPATVPYTTTLKRDTNYTCSVTFVGQSPPPLDPWGRANISIFIDFNHDGDFTDPGETIIGGSTVPNGSLTFSVPVPANALLGNTTMRISTKNVAQLTPIVSCDPDAASQNFIITIGPASGCETLGLNPDVIGVNCYEQSNGSINLNTSGGTTPYTFNWTNGSITEEITNLTKGIYQATVTDANGCEVATPLIPVLQPMALSIDTARDSNNAIHVLVSGGTTPYNYLWSNDSTSSVSNNFTSGTYSVKVTDAHGCDTTMQGIVITTTAIIPPPPPPVDSVTVTDSSININVYPNPNTGTIYLQSQKQQYLHIEIVNEQGKIMNDGYYTIGNGNATPINIAAYAGGIYFLKIVGDKSTKVVKVIKVMK